MQTSRRQFLQWGLTSTVLLTTPLALAEKLKQPPRHIAFDNLHTGEKLKVAYWEAGFYKTDALKQINHILRDHRTDEQMPIDRHLIDLLNLLHTELGSKSPFQIISGYRSSQTNSMLRKTSDGVAKKSLHMVGKAIDVRLADVELSRLREAALTLNAGGVGYYPKSNFVHLDTGRPRQWQG
ncbi:MAG: Twin-arginine translocation pathway signal [Methylophaga sp.]|uniref:YcbK family protein n=1 Tax=Methylophaga sp. UBA678 TaxID=1946901 RepID=UPI000C3E012C|nr:DUF882 domain-containing protein [Methylophaga sp. UBA678]MAX53252.1 Twin-arginine translocation pathway signal [Methylophaga sp.]|tara:strand:- start:117196 stop:117738 length:543 start_codon:yes stop_codon:yes gene_type:complete